MIKVLNNRIRFEHPIILNPDKKYRLGVSHLMFSLRQTFFIQDFWFGIHIPIPTTKEHCVSKNSVTGSYTIKALEKELQTMFTVAYGALVEKMTKDKKTDTVNKLKSATRIHIKLKIQKLNNNYVLVLNTPFPLEIMNIGNFSKIFKFEQTIRNYDKILPNTDYISENISELLSPLSVIEWHCNITEYSYANHDDHPHIHKQEELLHISFIDNNFYLNPVYKESHKKTLFILLREGLREVRERILTPQNEKNEELKNLRNITVYLQPKEDI